MPNNRTKIQKSMNTCSEKFSLKYHVNSTAARIWCFEALDDPTVQDAICEAAHKAALRLLTPGPHNVLKP